VTDPEAMERFQALYADHHAAVYAYAVSRAGRQLADEVVSETFLVAWRRLAEVPAQALPWLLTVARNTACSQFRGSARQRSIGAELRAWVTEAELSAPDVADEVAERTAVLAVLAALPEADRELLTLVAWHGLKPAEAARVVGCSTAAYFVRLHRARRRLERAMADPPEHAGPPQAVGRPERAGPPQAVGPPERVRPPQLAGLPQAAGPPEAAGPPDSARLGDPVLAHREEQAR
jgi:RNA polymerase sigma-70 factor, ECF subfamily